MLIIGIDIGLEGIIAIGEGSEESFKIKEIKPIPTIQLKKNKRDYSPSDIFKSIPEDIQYAVIEKPLSMPAQRIQTCASLWKCLGYVEMAIIAKRIPYQIVHPSTWKKELIKDISGDMKAKSIIACKRLFPEINLKRTERSKKDDDNIAEAILLAYYGWRVFMK